MILSCSSCRLQITCIKTLHSLVPMTCHLSHLHQNDTNLHTRDFSPSVIKHIQMDCVLQQQTRDTRNENDWIQYYTTDRVAYTLPQDQGQDHTKGMTISSSKWHRIWRKPLRLLLVLCVATKFGYVPRNLLWHTPHCFQQYHPLSEYSSREYGIMRVHMPSTIMHSWVYRQDQAAPTPAPSKFSRSNHILDTKSSSSYQIFGSKSIDLESINLGTLKSWCTKVLQKDVETIFSVNLAATIPNLKVHSVPVLCTWLCTK